MKRSITLLAALVVLSVWIVGCSGPPQKDIKDAFVQQLTGFCAEVNRKLKGIEDKAQPGIYADQFALLAEQARRRQPKSKIDREQFEILVTEFENTARHYRSAQTALTAGDQPTADAALEKARLHFASANAAAQKYGMPALGTCQDRVSGTSPHAPDPSAAPAPAAAWQPRDKAAVAVQQVNATKLGEQIWVAGGWTASGEATASTQFYDPAINSWGLGPPLPVALHHAMLVTYRNQLVVIGGFQARNNDMLGFTSPQMLSLDNKTRQWVDGPPLNHPRAAGGAAVVGNEIVVVGGRTGNPKELVTQTEIFDGTRWRVGADILHPGDHIAVTADSRYLYAVGGREFTADTNSDVVQRYDPKADRWDILTPTPQPVSGAGAAIVDGRLIVVGSEEVTTVSGTVQAYDLTASTWTALPALDPGRHGLGVTAIGNTLYAIGGATKPGHTASTNLVTALRFS
jgi:hypothetical protein